MSRSLTVEQTTYSPLLRVLNAACGVAERLDLPFTHVGEEVFLDLARRQTGLSDFGDPGFLEGMRHLLDNVEELGMTPLARQVLRGTFLQGLRNRLRYQEHVRKHPDVLTQRVDRPIFVLGFPRSGTTLIQNLLALHDRRRGIPFWELYTPVPTSADPVRDERERRRAAARTISVAHLVAPEQREVHDIRVDTLEECWYLFWNSMQVLNWDIQTGLHSYGRWLLDHDMTGAYREYKGWLQLFQHRDPVDNLVLKCPEHLWFIDDLLTVFPDACIIWTHRDPVDSVASYCSMMSLTRRLIYGAFEPKAMGPYVGDRFLDGVQRAMAARDAWGDERTFFDVGFHELVRDPEDVLRRACTHFDLPWCEDYPARIAAWQDSDREDKRGRHRYTTEAFGVRAETVHEQFAPYIRRFDIELGDPE
ncbi:MAG: sulfotransferase [Alphaproteobacteria bacterium]|nr:sulfotransferase [Alphaproteobacteria bacterium]